MSSKVQELINKRIASQNINKVNEGELIEILTLLLNTDDLVKTSWEVATKHRVSIGDLLNVVNPPQYSLDFKTRPRNVFRISVLKKIYEDYPNGFDKDIPVTYDELNYKKYREIAQNEPCYPTIQELCQGLDVDVPKVKELLKDRDLMEVARTLGSDLVYSGHQLLAGNIVFLYNLMNSFEDMSDYIEYFNPVLNRTNEGFYKALCENKSTFNYLIKYNIPKIFNRTYFSAITTYSMYLLKKDFHLPVRENLLQFYIRVALDLWYTDVRKPNHLGCFTEVNPNEEKTFVSLEDPYDGVNDVVKSELREHDNQRVDELSISGKKHMLKVVDRFYTLLHKLSAPATPTLCNSGTLNNQKLSCFMIDIEDNLESIVYSGVGDCSIIEKYDGGIGLWLSKLRHSSIRNRYESEGVVPFCRVLNKSIAYVKRSQGKRGAANIYLRPHHIDLLDFIKMIDRDADAKETCLGLQITLWMPHLFYRRLEDPDSMWTMFCPKYVTELESLYGPEFETMYEYLENSPDIPDRYRIKMKTSDIFDIICQSVAKNGLPFIMDGDGINMKCNQKNIGPISGSNLCTEITEEGDSKNIPSCNLANQVLNAFVKGKVKMIDGSRSYNMNEIPIDRSTNGLENNLTEVYDFKLLARNVIALVEDLNSTIDTNWYPLDKRDDQGNVIALGKIHRPNIERRPIGIGYSGFAYAVSKLNLPFDHSVTEKLNIMIAYCRYFNGMASSIQEAIIYGPYKYFNGSPLSQGKFQFDLWAEETKIKGTNPFRRFTDDLPLEPSEWKQDPYILNLDDGSKYTIEPTWDSLRTAVMKFGVRNSLLFCEQPTATTAQFSDVSEGMEPYQSNLFSREVVIGDFEVMPRSIINDLTEIGAWNKLTYSFIQANEGCVNKLHDFVETFKDHYPQNINMNYLKWIELKYKTIWEISQDTIMRYASQRARVTCQSQSLNIHKYAPSQAEIKALHIRAERYGLKTHHYYFRTLPEAETSKFTIPTWFKELLRQRNYKIEIKYEKTVQKKRNMTVNCSNCT